MMRTITSDTSVHARSSLALRLNALRDRVYIVVLTAKLAVDCPKHVRYRLTLSLETAVCLANLYEQKEGNEALQMRLLVSG
jgi:hypothetical protein